MFLKILIEIKMLNLNLYASEIFISRNQSQFVMQIKSLKFQPGFVIFSIGSLLREDDRKAAEHC